LDHTHLAAGASVQWTFQRSTNCFNVVSFAIESR